MNRVFICYSHKDRKYLDLLLNHIDDNLLDVWSDKRIKGGENWREEIQESLDNCNSAVLLISKNFIASEFIQRVELVTLLKNEFKKNTYLVPILVKECNLLKEDWLRNRQILPSNNKSLNSFTKESLKKEISLIHERILELVNPNKEKIKDKKLDSYNYPEIIVENNNFPCSNDKFFGREKYFNILDNAWNNEQVNILSLIAFGGIGKTSLVDNWLKKMKEKHYKGANKIFMWSFYSQGNEEDKQISASEFLQSACEYFGVKNFSEKDSSEQGRELANIVGKQRSLIVLDGLEPLQSSLEDLGKIKDYGLEIFLKKLSRQNKGLVVITSRIKLSSINNEYEELEKLENSEGAELLKSFGLNGSDKELEQISKDVGAENVKEMYHHAREMLEKKGVI
jgi:hypothetical protein